MELSESSGPGPARIPTDVAHNARVWNYWLGGKDHYAVDVAVGDHITGIFPSIGDVARADRAFLRRAVTHLAREEGVRQYLDIGTGLPTHENTHEVAQGIAPESRIVYVDNDPTVLVHAHALLTSSPEGATDYIEADAHDPAKILEGAARTLDFDKPVAVMMLGILNFVSDTEEAVSIAHRVMEAMPSGSFLALTHPTHDLGGEGIDELVRFWNENAEPPITVRSRAEILRFFDGLDLLEPGLAACSDWRVPEDEKGPDVAEFAGLARKP